MKEKKIYAFKGLLIYGTIAIAIWGCCFAIADKGGYKLRDFNHLGLGKKTILSLVYGLTLVLPGFIISLIHRFVVGGGLLRFDAFAFSKGVIDEDWNWEVLISEVKDVELVKLSKEEKKKYTSTRFLFSKYLKVTTKNDKYKYIYVSHFTKKQIERIINILLQR